MIWHKFIQFSKITKEWACSGCRIPSQSSFPQPTSLSYLTTVLHIHMAMATKPPKLIKASFTFFKDYDIIFSCI